MTFSLKTHTHCSTNHTLILIQSILDYWSNKGLFWRKASNWNNKLNKLFLKGYRLNAPLRLCSLDSMLIYWGSRSHPRRWNLRISANSILFWISPTKDRHNTIQTQLSVLIANLNLSTQVIVKQLFKSRKMCPEPLQSFLSPRGANTPKYPSSQAWTPFTIC